jgi:excisionase family DNA binding protein
MSSLLRVGAITPAHPETGGLIVSVGYPPHVCTSPDQPAAARLLYRPDEAAEMLAIGRAKFYELMTSGEIESIKIGKARRIPRESLEGFIASRLTRGQDSGAGILDGRAGPVIDLAELEHPVREAERADRRRAGLDNKLIDRSAAGAA